MELNFKRRFVRCWWFYFYVFAMHDVTRNGFGTHADDICDRSASNDIEISVNIGQELLLSCLSDIEPSQNRLTWFKNGMSIEDDERTVVVTRDRAPCTSQGSSNSCDCLKLSILSIVAEDEGLFICQGAGVENGTIFVRVLEGTTSTTPAIFGTTMNRTSMSTTLGPSLTKPTCYSNISSEDVLLRNDSVVFTCTTDRTTFSVGSLDWVDHESLQIKHNNSYSTSLLMDVSTALSFRPSCVLTCDGGVRSCRGEILSCSLPLLEVSPLYQEAEVGGTVSFTCEISLKNYTVTWFAPGSAKFGDDQLNIQRLNDGRVSVFTISNLQPGQFGSLFCRAQQNGTSVGIPLAVRFEVASSSTDGVAEDIARSLVADQTDGPTIAHNVTSGCVFLRQLDTVPRASSPLSSSLIVVIAVCGGVVFVIIIAVIVSIICRRQRDKDTGMDINPVMAFGDMDGLDNPVNMDVHFNVYSQHEIYDEPARSTSDILRLDTPKRIPSVIHGGNAVYSNGDAAMHLPENGHAHTDRSSSFMPSNGHPGHAHAERKSSFIPISEDQLDGDHRRRHNDDDDEPGRKLSYYVDGDIYVTYDSNA